MSILNEGAATRKRAALFFHGAGVGVAYPQGKGKLGEVEQARRVFRQVAEFVFFFLGHCVIWVWVKGG